MFSVVVDGRVEDICYKRQNEWSYLVYLGDRYLGQVFRIRSKAWNLVSANSSDIPMSLGEMCGFMTRDAATEMLMRLNKIGGR